MKKTLSKSDQAKKSKAAPVQAPVGMHRINDRAMLVGLAIRRWHPHVIDKTATEEVAKAHHTTTDLGRYAKRLAPKDALKEINSIINRMRATHCYMTLPWSDNGERILGAAGYFQYVEKMNKLIHEFNLEVDTNIVPNYPKWKAEQKHVQNGLYNEDDYPPDSEIKGRYKIEVMVSPIPAGEDLRVDIGDQEIANVRKQLDGQVEDRIKEGMKDAWVRLKQVVEHAVERLKAYSVDKEGKVSHPFRDSLITNIIELLDIIPVLNVTGDPALAKFADEIRVKVGAYTADQLRNDEAKRVSVAEAANDILKKMQEFMA